MKINNAGDGAGFALFVCAITLLASISVPFAHAQSDGEEKDKGTAVFSDSPYVTGKHKTKKVTPPDSDTGHKADMNDQGTADEEDDYGLYESKVESNSSGSGVDMIEPVTIEYSVSGFAKVIAKIKNNLDYPVDGLRLDILFFHKSRRRSNQYQIPFTNGKLGTKPDMLMPGESGDFDFETGLKPSIIAGYRFRLVWNQFDKIEPKNPKQLPGNVTKITIPAQEPE